MVNKDIKITLDKERKLKLTLKGLVEFEKATGTSFMDVTNLQELTLEQTGALLWACLLPEDHDLKLDYVMYMVDPGQIVEITRAVLECIQASFPEAKAETAPLAVNCQCSTGSNSGLSDGTALD